MKQLPCEDPRTRERTLARPRRTRRLFQQGPLLLAPPGTFVGDTVEAVAAHDFGSLGKDGPAELAKVRFVFRWHGWLLAVATFGLGFGLDYRGPALIPPRKGQART